MEKIKIDRPTDYKFWFNFVNPFVKQYNTIPNSAFDNKYSPKQILDNHDHAQIAHDIDIENRTGHKDLKNPDLKPNDEVRIPLTKDKIEKKHRQTYTTEIFTVDKILRARPIKQIPARVKLLNSQGESIQGELPVNSILKVKPNQK